MGQEDTDVLATQQNQDPEPSTKEGEGTGDPQEVDWKARAEAAEAEVGKVKNDLKAQEGRRTRDQMFQELVDDHGVTRQMVTTLLKRTASGETDALAGDIATIDQAAAQTKATRTWADNQNEAYDALKEAIVDGERYLLSDEDQETLKPLFKVASDAQDIGAYYRVISQATRMSKNFMKAEAAAALTKQADEAKTSKKASDIKNGIGDMSTGQGSSGGGTMSWDQAQKSTNLEEVMADYTKLIAES